jgi:hypothetical protein
MFPAEAIVQAASRWLRLLRHSTLSQASSIIRADSAYTDLTQTQYGLGLDLLMDLDLMNHAAPGGASLSSEIKELPGELRDQLLFERTLEIAAPNWLPDADLLVPDSDEVPQDAAALAHALKLTESAAFLSIRRVHGRIDLAERARVGLAGEIALIALLERRWPRSTTHVSAADDSFGYDIAFQHEERQWHLEVKSTTRRGRLRLYLSRHEHEVGLRDPHWRLVVLGLDDQLQLKVITTVRHGELLSRAPRDAFAEAKWQSASHELTANDLELGFSFLNVPDIFEDSSADPGRRTGAFEAGQGFAWMLKNSDHKAGI